MAIDEQAGMRRMLEDIRREAYYTSDETGLPLFQEAVMAAMAAVPRLRFVPHGLEAAAFDNGPLPIGHGQPSSLPYIVALMCELLQVGKESVVLEVGTGSGYQAAVLAELVRQVYSLELVGALADEAAQRLQRLGYHNVEVRQGDGYHGWPEHAPFDGIIVTAAAPHVPQALVDQLREGARLVIPVGEHYGPQQLLVVTKHHGRIEQRRVLPVAFVPLHHSAASPPAE
ncbi:MAG TPA: protein-L-isoaspartate(D-aspartate) O-methyltransferase [Gammaproteobacteria bacterium]